MTIPSLSQGLHSTELILNQPKEWWLVGQIPYRMGLTILAALAQLLEVDRVGVEAYVSEVPNHRAAALDRAPRPVLLKPEPSQTVLLGGMVNICGDLNLLTCVAQEML
jgi:hypothetical protein